MSVPSGVTTRIGATFWRCLSNNSAVMIWIVEAGAFRTGADALEEAVRLTGGEIRWLSEDDEFRGRYGSWELGEAVVFRGSFEAAESFRRRRADAHPGVIGDAAALRCSSYYSGLGNRLLNLQHEFLPLGELRLRWHELQAVHGEGLFVRPDSGAKAFTGQLVTDLDRFESRERPYLALMEPSELLVIAPPRRIEAEWRTVVVGTEVVSGSRYKSWGERNVDPDVPSNVLEFARATASEIKPPDSAYTLDVVREEGGRLSVVEFNSFSCSDLYACDPGPIVKAVQDLFR